MGSSSSVRQILELSFDLLVTNYITVNVVASKPVAARTANEVAMLNALSKGLCEASRIEVIFIMETALNEG